MNARPREQIAEWLDHWGFGAAVVGIAAVSIVVAVATTVPASVPSFALEARVIYRLEIGAAFFAALYLVATAVVLALHNRAFTELSTSGISARSVRAEKRQGQSHQIEENAALIRGAVAEIRKIYVDNE